MPKKWNEQDALRFLKDKCHLSRELPKAELFVTDVPNLISETSIVEVVCLSDEDWMVAFADQQGRIWYYSEIFPTNGAAWKWVDKNTNHGRADIDRHNRIRNAFNGLH